MQNNKPFFLVQQVPPDRQKIQDDAHDNKYNGKLRVTITVKTPLHFGAGQLLHDSKDSHFVNRLCRENEQIALPGSSFKGMLRSVYEALSGSCLVTIANCETQAQAMSRRRGRRASWGR